MPSCYNLIMKFDTWDEFFTAEKEKIYYRNMINFIDDVYAKEEVFPLKKDVFKAFELTPLKEVKVVILGQDPYHQPDQAMGLAFSVSEGIPLPRSLINIYKEIENDCMVAMNKQSGDLTYLARQGVLLFNPIFTVRKGQPLSHANPLYDELTKNIFALLSSLEVPIVYMLWGTKAQKWEKYISNRQSLIIKATHPSPLGANQGGFFGQKMFTKANDYLRLHHRQPIEWQNH